MLINKKTGERFVSATEQKSYDMHGKPRNVYLLIREEDGTKKEVSENFFKANIIEEAEQELMPMPGTEDPNWGERAAGKKPKREYKDAPDSVEEDEVVMRAFTGMLIGTFKIVKQTKTYIAVKTADGVTMKFDKKTGIQLEAKNPRFANRIDI